MTTEFVTGFEAQITEIHTMLVQIHGMLAQPKEAREWYTVEEVAALLSKSPYSVREWCRFGRINATKRSERRGGAELWSISAGEIARYRDEGLLPIDPRRNPSS
jgi:Helix-turn-helix domain